jgi:PadR family transcriptional regulator, regulatory protein PadR
MARFQSGQAIRLNEVEELILRALSSPSGTELYGLQIVDAISTVCKKKVAMGTLYPVLHKLKEKNFVNARWEVENIKGRAGARRRYYRITCDGERALQTIDKMRMMLTNWQPVV